ncbi:DUF192 domain-containing protein [Sinanaerobacter chloroacetimidivorans]|uniref:DUF192 domain-containing protein n=1 Tax=Sinanaerobacter chloroacetimidivorans TaxID=2818044 RepID=A0A8J7W6E2_9FIRM|nr:DUF192 domain-containing protein [Sinanaerobacter chloroacetimidivorans]MBR0600015.1 DUF192 domain-containing protein [Sinanaerobacter chloroacetimidivorans]
MILYSENKVIANRIQIADSFLARLIGLLGKKSLSEEEGMLLFHCPAIHCFFMKMAIDAVYLSNEMKVLYIETLRPWKMGKYVRKAAHVLELAEGTAHEKIRLGEQLQLSVNQE